MDFNIIDNVMEAYNWQLAQIWLDKIRHIIEPGKIYVFDKEMFCGLIKNCYEYQRFLKFQQ